jgi:Reverse transcriptase (RNA-dependent DNA polymerase)
MSKTRSAGLKQRNALSSSLVLTKTRTGKRALTLDGQTGDLSPLGGSLSQGSPISSILYMLFMAPLYLKGAHLRGYADDGIIKAAGRMPGDNVAYLQRELNSAQEWCNANGLELDMGKTGLFHITRKRTTDNPGIQLPDGRTVEAIEVKKTIRWLGVLFDRKMSFKAHVKEACCRASKVVNGIKILAGCYDTKAPRRTPCLRPERASCPS